jgi:hypothetical protein
MADSRFKPGQSGNPGGRPKEVAHVRELARVHTAEAISTLAAIMRDAEEPAAARARAAEVLLNRAWGTPETTAKIGGVEGDTIKIQWVRDLSDDELGAIIANAADPPA